MKADLGGYRMTGTAGTVERRDGGQDRIPMNKLVTILSGHGGEMVTADTVNLGPGGMFVATERPFGIGDRFICRIDLGETYKPVLSGAEVRWIDADTNRRGMGVCFLDIAEVASSLGGDLPTAKGPESVRVRLESVGTAFDGEVIERSDEELVVDLELPFLRGGAKVEVGPDVAARTSVITSTEFLADPKAGGTRLRLRLNLEPTAAEVAAEQVSGGRRSRVMVGSDIAQKMASAVPEPVIVAPKRKKKVKKTRVRAKSNWARRAALLQWSEKEESPETDAAATAAAEAVAEEARRAEAERQVADIERRAATRREVEAREAEAADLSVAGEIVEEPTAEELDEPSEAVAASDHEPKAEVTAAPAKSEGAELAVEESEESSDSAKDDEIDASTFSPLRGALERVCGVALATRLMAAMEKARTSIGSRINGPAALAAARWVGGKLSHGWQWTRGKVGPAFANLGKALSRSRRRRQSRGEPSKVVRNLTDRARKVAAGRGKTVAAAFLIVIGLTGLGAAGWGLWGSTSVESEREQMQSEASAANWNADLWQESGSAELPNS